MPTICSVAHGGLELYNGPGYGRIFVPGRGQPGVETGRYTSVSIPDVILEPEDVGGLKKIIHEKDGAKEARLLAAPFAERGVFVPEKDVPSEAELVAAEARYTETLRLAIEEGMKQWEKRHLPQDVDDLAKIGAHVFRVTVPWGVPARSSVTIECEGCGEQISPKLAWHGACGAIFDEERAIALGYVPAIQAKKERLSLAAVTAPPKGGGKQAAL